MTNLPTPEDVGFGHIVTTETVHAGALTSFLIEVEQSLNVDSTTVLQSVIEALGLINKRKTRKLVITIAADPNFKIERVTKRYTAVDDAAGRVKENKKIESRKKPVDYYKH